MNLTHECKIQVDKLKLDKNEQVKVTSELLEALLISEHDDDSSSKTIIYWSGGQDMAGVNKTVDEKPKFIPVALNCMTETKIKQAQIMPCKCWVIHSKPSKAKGGSKITLHRLARRQLKYYFKCYVSG